MNDRLNLSTENQNFAADLFVCPVCAISFLDGSANHWRCQWIMHPDDIVKVLTARCGGMPEQDRKQFLNVLTTVLFGHDSSRPKFKSAPDAVGERAVLERLETEWWEDIGKPALDAAFPPY